MLFLDFVGIGSVATAVKAAHEGTGPEFRHGRVVRIRRR
jgi:hypothetical protein